MTCGIYKIVHEPTGRCYVGQSQDVERRMNDHLKSLENKKHPNEHLQNAWDKYGEEQFSFEIVEACNLDFLSEREQFWIDNLDSEFNKSRCVESFWRGMRHSEKTLEKMSRVQKGNSHASGYRHTEEAKRKIAESARGRKHTEEAKRKISDSKKGKKLSDKHRKTLSEAHKGNPKTLFALSKASSALRGVRWSQERKDALSAKFKGRVKTPEHLEKIAEAKRGQKHSEESKAKMRAARLRYLERKRAAE